MTKIAPVIDLGGKDRGSILFLTDLHYPKNDRAYIQECLKGRWDAILLGGDLTEGRTRISPGARVNEPSEKEAIRQLKEDLHLIRKDVPVVGVLGNHDNAGIRASGQDITPMELIFEQFGFTFSNNHVIVPIRVGRSIFKVLMTHGAGGGGSEAAVFRFLKQIHDTIDDSCDLYLCGHWHKYLVKEETKRATRMAKSGLVPTTLQQFFMTCGSPITYEGSYAEGGPKARPYKKCSVMGLELQLYGTPESNHKKVKEFQHRILYR